MKKISIALTILLFGMTLAPVLALAAFGETPGNSSTLAPPGNYSTLPPPGNSSTDCSAGGSIFQLCNPLQVKSICQLIKALLNIIILLGIPVATFFVVYAGFKLVVARGRPAELAAARLNLFYTVVGIAIFLGAWLLAQVISNTIAALGIQILGSCTN